MKEGQEKLQEEQKLLLLNRFKIQIQHAEASIDRNYEAGLDDGWKYD